MQWRAVRSRRMSGVAWRAADARYDSERRAPLAVRLTEEQWRWLEAQAKHGEKPAQAMLRLAGVPGAPPNVKLHRTHAAPQLDQPQHTDPPRGMGSE
jgi:hypothetical protein